MVAAFQAHGDTAAVGEAAARIGRDIGQDAGLIARLLTGRENAVLAADSCLVRLRGNGVMWNPADYQCVLGELLIEEGSQGGWRLSGELYAVEPRQ